jgi:hypothetical protein
MSETYRRAIIQITRYQNVSQMQKILKKVGFVILYDEGYFPALRHITLLLSHEINYHKSVSLMYQFLRKMLVLSKETDNGRKFLLERGHVVVNRVNCVTTVNRISVDGPRTFVFA